MERNTLKITKSIRLLIEQAKIKEALDLLAEHFKESQNDITLVKSKFAKYTKDSTFALEDSEELRVVLARIINETLSILSDVEERAENAVNLAAPANDKTSQSPIATILSFQLQFLKSTIKKLLSTRKFLIGITLAPILVFGIFYFLLMDYIQGVALLFFIVIIVLICLSIASLSLLLNNHVESFRQNKENLKQQQIILELKEERS